MLGGLFGLDELVVGLVDGGLHLDDALAATGAANRPVGAEQVTVGGRRPHARLLPDELARHFEVVHDREPIQRPVHRATQRLRHLDQVDRPGSTEGQRGPTRLVHNGLSPTDQQSGTPRIVVPQHLQRGHRVVATRNRDRVGDRAQRGGQRDLGTGPHGEQRGDRTEHARQPLARREQRTSAVLAGQAERERVDPGLPGRDLLLRGAFGPHQLLDPRLRRIPRRNGELVAFGKVDVVGLLATDLGLRLGQFDRGDLGAFLGLGQRGGQPLDLVGGRVVLAAQRLDLTG